MFHTSKLHETITTYGDCDALHLRLVTPDHKNTAASRESQPEASQVQSISTLGARQASAAILQKSFGTQFRAGWPVCAETWLVTPGHLSAGVETKYPGIEAASRNRPPSKVSQRVKSAPDWAWTGPRSARMELASRSCALHLRLVMLNKKNTAASRET